MRNAREKTGNVGEVHGCRTLSAQSTSHGSSINPHGYRGRDRLSRFPLGMKKPELEDGSVYAQRWMEGARSLEEVAPTMAAWVRWRAVRRGLITTVLLWAAISVSFMLAGPFLP